VVDVDDDRLDLRSLVHASSGPHEAPATIGERFQAVGRVHRATLRGRRNATWNVDEENTTLGYCQDILSLSYNALPSMIEVDP